MNKILVANRGEIAVRVFRAARELGMGTVAVYSEADQDSLHVQFADQAVCIGGPEPGSSYLRGDAVIDAAKKTGADAIHPGYGFLSERAEFSEACESAGLIFIGPPASAMRMLGDKISAKKLAVENHVPITPGFFEPGAKDSELLEAARRIGFPVMLKASAGGGGRGMRIVHEESAFMAEASTARDEALRGFGSDEMMVEKLVQRPRHIEVQLMADQHGSVAALFERECSIQRRHQKLIEEAPSPVMTEELWQHMREASIRLAKAAGYVGAGTVEFMLDDATGEFYFLEVNARLQVEHPVTEAITGLDLVRLQFFVAQGERLENLVSEEIMAGNRKSIRGHAIELRVVAENPSKGFLPSIGKLIGWAMPTGPGVRVDTGYQLDGEITRFYDSLVSKVICHGPSRRQAIERCREALLDTHILGVQTNVGYLSAVLADQEFAEAAFDTGFLGRREDLLVSEDLPVGLLELVNAGSRTAGSRPLVAAAVGAWATGDGFRNVRANS